MNQFLRKKNYYLTHLNLKTGIGKHCFVVQPLQEPLICSSIVKIILIAIYVSTMKENKALCRLFLWATVVRWFLRNITFSKQDLTNIKCQITKSMTSVCLYNLEYGLPKYERKACYPSYHPVCIWSKFDRKANLTRSTACFDLMSLSYTFKGHLEGTSSSILKLNTSKNTNVHARNCYKHF